MQPVSDFHLLAETSPERRAPFGEFYRRHAAAVYDFAWRVLKNADAAREALRDTFHEAFDTAGMVVRPADVRNWLYGIAYRAVMARWENGVEPSEEPPPSPPALVPEDAEVEIDPETAALVWEAASGLDPRHYALLDLDLRRDFDGGDIAVITGQNRAQTVSLVARLERVVEGAILSYVVARRGAAACDQLRIILGDARIPPFPPDLRALVDRHIEACDTCYALRQRVPSPLETLAAFEPVAPPEPVLSAILAEALGEAPPAEEEPEPEAVEPAEIGTMPFPPDEPAALSEPAAVAAPEAVHEAPESAAEAAEAIFPAEGIEEEPEALVVRGTSVSGEQAPLAPATERAGAAFAPSPAESLPETAWPPPGPAAASPEAEAEIAPAPAPEPAAAPGAAPPRRAPPRWREWLQRPWVSFGVGVAGGLLIIATVVAFMFASGGGGGASETPTPSPTATPEPVQMPAIVPTATDTPEPTPTDTPEPAPTEAPTATPTATPPEPTATPSPTEPPASPAPGTPAATGTPAPATPAATPTP